MRFLITSVLEDKVGFVHDTEAEKRLEKERLKRGTDICQGLVDFHLEEKKKQEAEEPAAKRRKVGDGPKKQGSITSFFKTTK